MTIHCSDIRVALVDDTLSEEQRAHVSSCETCLAFEGALGQVDDALDQLQWLEPPQAVISQTLSAVAAAQSETPPDKPAKVSFLFKAALPLSMAAGLAFAFLTFGSVRDTMTPIEEPMAGPVVVQTPKLADDMGRGAGWNDKSTLHAGFKDQTPSGNAAVGALAGADDGKTPPKLPAPASGEAAYFETPDEPEISGRRAEPKTADAFRYAAPDSTATQRLPASPVVNLPTTLDRVEPAQQARAGKGEKKLASGYVQPGTFNVKIEGGDDDQSIGDLKGMRQRELTPEKAVERTLKEVPVIKADADGRDGLDSNEVSKVRAENRRRNYDQKKKGKLRAITEAEKAQGSQNGLLKQEVTEDARVRPSNTSPTVSLLTLRNQAPKRFQAATGYWENTYVPGDPELRFLEAKLAKNRRIPALERSVTRPRQPFDAPDRSAMALQLSSDTPQLEGPKRMLLQVGLKSSAAAALRRPALTLALVVDADAPLDAAAKRHLERLLLAFSEKKQSKDTFMLYASGPNGGLRVPAKDFRFGALNVEMSRLTKSGKRENARSLQDVLAEAVRNLANGADSAGPLGASGVIVVTSRTLGSTTSTLQRIAHQSAVRGVPVSVFGISGKVAPSEMTRIALWGHGQRRMVGVDSDAKALVSAQMRHVSEVVARALRLHVRLGKGVKLIDVVGSRRLGAAERKVIKEAEESIDQRLARDLAIEADRGDDDDGIQIIIPAFRADDSHVVLLDVMAPGPGTIADVTLRYKDLVRLDNGVARARFVAKSGPPRVGRGERNVLRNFVAQNVGTSLVEAADLLQANRSAQARVAVQRATALVQGLSQTWPAFRKDPALARDISMLAQYARLISRDDRSARAELIASLRVAGKRKTQPNPRTLDP